MNDKSIKTTMLVAALFIGGGKCSTSFAQRKIGIGYNAAAFHVETLQDAKVISAASSTGQREILVETVAQAEARLRAGAQS